MAPLERALSAWEPYPSFRSTTCHRKLWDVGRDAWCFRCETDWEETSEVLTMLQGIFCSGSLATEKSFLSRMLSGTKPDHRAQGQGESRESACKTPSFIQWLLSGHNPILLGESQTSRPRPQRIGFGWLRRQFWWPNVGGPKGRYYCLAHPPITYSQCWWAPAVAPLLDAYLPHWQLHLDPSKLAIQNASWTPGQFLSIGEKALKNIEK